MQSLLFIIQTLIYHGRRHACSFLFLPQLQRAAILICIQCRTKPVLQSDIPHPHPYTHTHEISPGSLSQGQISPRSSAQEWDSPYLQGECSLQSCSGSPGGVSMKNKTNSTGENLYSTSNHGDTSPIADFDRYCGGYYSFNIII